MKCNITAYIYTHDECLCQKKQQKNPTKLLFHHGQHPYWNYLNCFHFFLLHVIMRLCYFAPILSLSLSQPRTTLYLSSLYTSLLILLSPAAFLLPPLFQYYYSFPILPIIFLIYYLIRVRATFGFPKADLHIASPLWRPKSGHPNTIDHCHFVWRPKSDVTPLSYAFWFEVSSKLIARINCENQIHTGLYTTCRIGVTIVKTSKLATSR